MQLSVREGTVLRTRTVDNDLNPTWDQRFNLLVDDADTQSLRALLCAPLQTLSPSYACYDILCLVTAIPGCSCMVVHYQCMI